MKPAATVLVVSDIHYASCGEQARPDPEGATVERPWLRPFARGFRRLWLGNTTRNNAMLARFVAHAPAADLVVANGDLSCDSAFVGLADPAAFGSADECLRQLRGRFGDRVRVTLGDHELGRRSLFGGAGGMRLDSWERSLVGLAIPSIWRATLGPYLLLGVTSSLVDLEAHQRDLLPDEREVWERLREQHLRDIRDAFAALEPSQRLVLFIHDPAALARLDREAVVRERRHQIVWTVVGHLHLRTVIALIWAVGGLRLAWAALRPPGHGDRRAAAALIWKEYRVRVCPALACRPWPWAGRFYRLTLDFAAQTSRLCLERL